MDEKLTFRNAEGDGLSAVLGLPENPNGNGIVMLHCFTCTKHHRIMRGLSECLLAHGFTTLRFDFSGNGESGGKIEDATYTKMLGETAAAVAVLKKRGCKRIGAAGHSMGAMLALLAAHGDKRINAVAFISGSSQAARVREVFPPDAVEKAEREGVSRAFVYGRDITLKREFLLDVEKYNVGHAVAVLHRPLLIVHGSADEIIPPFHARQLHAWSNNHSRLEMVGGADHLFRDERNLARMRSLVCSWFSEAL